MWYERLISKNFLICVNIAFIPVSILLIGIGFSDYSILCCTPTAPFIHGISVCGGVLFLIAILGIVSILKNITKLINLYTFLLLIVSVIQFSISCACFSQTYAVLEQKSPDLWELENEHAPFDSIHKIEKNFGCCGYDEDDPRRDPNVSDPVYLVERLWCENNVESCKVRTIAPEVQHVVLGLHNTSQPYSAKRYSQFPHYKNVTDLPCPICKEPFTRQFKKIIDMVGVIGFLFALIQFAICFLTYKYLNHKKPRNEGTRILSDSFTF